MLRSVPHDSGREQKRSARTMTAIVSTAAILPPFSPTRRRSGAAIGEIGAFFASLAGMRQKGHGQAREAGGVIPVPPTFSGTYLLMELS